MSDKLPQANYENKVNKKNHSFTKKNQNDLPDINIRGPVVNKVKIIKKEKEKDPDQIKERERERERDSSNTHSNHNNISSKKYDEEKEQGTKENSMILNTHQNEGRKKHASKDPSGLNMIEEEKDNSSKVLREKSPVQKKEHHRNNSGGRKDMMLQEENSYQGIQISRKNLSPVNNNHKNVLGSVMPPITNCNSNRDTYELPQVKNIRKKENS